MNWRVIFDIDLSARQRTALCRLLADRFGGRHFGLANMRNWEYLSTECINGSLTFRDNDRIERSIIRPFVDKDILITQAHLDWYINTGEVVLEYLDEGFYTDSIDFEFQGEL